MDYKTEEFPDLKFRCRWSGEAARDLVAFYGEDAMKDLIFIMLEEMMSQAFHHIRDVAVGKGMNEETFNEWADEHNINVIPYE